jgi:predicted dehydrogenase
MPTKASRARKPIRVGVIGVGRGQTFMHQAAFAGMELVAICDTWKERLDEVGKQYGITTYTEYARFLEHDMDAVVLANYFHEHAPFAIQALQAGKHVMSECAACSTLAEGVALCRAVEQSGRIYMLAENYPFTAFSLEMARLYKAGEIGRVLYAEGEYNHPMEYGTHQSISPGLRHWRNNLPTTYYCTHAMAPLMAITDTLPVRVNGFAPPLPEDSPLKRLWKQMDVGGIIMAQMDNGALFKLLQGGLPGHSIFYRLHGEGGLMETGRGPGYWGPGSVRIAHDEWALERGQVPEKPTILSSRGGPRKPCMPATAGATFSPTTISPRPSVAASNPTSTSTEAWPCRLSASWRGRACWTTATAMPCPTLA